MMEAGQELPLHPHNALQEVSRKNYIYILAPADGYAAVIFYHPVFQPHMNALSKLVLFSSLMHQLGFTLFSSLPFAIGTVQDAGLIFLSFMSNRIATVIMEQEDGTAEAVLSTTLVLLAGSTATLGLVLMLMGHFRLAE
jgi:SulP family sulfate permease